MTRVRHVGVCVSKLFARHAHDRQRSHFLRACEREEGCAAWHTDVRLPSKLRLQFSVHLGSACEDCEELIL